MKPPTRNRSRRRGSTTLLFLVLGVTLALGQNLVIQSGATFAGAGQYTIKGNITNSSVAAAKTISGTVNLAGTSAQGIGTATNGDINFATLKATAISVKTFAVNSTVSAAIDVTSGSTTAFNIGAKKLTLQGTIANNGGATTPYVFNTGGAEVVYAGTAASTQSIWMGAYDKLTLTGGAGVPTAFNLQGAVTVANTFAHSGTQPLAVNNNLTLSAGYTFATVSSIAASMTLTLGTTGSIAAVTDIIATGSMVNGSGALTVTALTDNHGTITAAANGGAMTFTNAAVNNGTITGGAGLVTFSNTLAQNGGTITAGSGTMLFNGVVTQTGGSFASSALANLLDFNANVANSAGTIILTGTGAAQFAGTVNATGLSFATGTTVTYNGSTAGQAIADVNYGNLTLKTSTKAWTLGAARTISNNLDVQASSGTTVGGSFDLNVSGNISLASNLTKSANAVVFANAASAVSGAGEIVGSVTRTHTFAASTDYTFNNASTLVNASVPGGLTSFTLKSEPGQNPTGYSLGHTVNRKFTHSYTKTATFTADVRLAYVSGEVGGAAEARLRDFQGGIVKANKLTGTYTRQAAGGGFGYVKLAALTDAILTSGSELALDDRFNAFTSIASAAWNVNTTWDENVVPAASDEVIIANNFPVSIPDAYAASALSVTINATSTGLTVGGGTSGSLGVGTGGLVNNNTGTGLTVANGASVTITGADLTNNGAITNNGTITVTQ